MKKKQMIIALILLSIVALMVMCTWHPTNVDITNDVDAINDTTISVADNITDTIINDSVDDDCILLDDGRKFCKIGQMTVKSGEVSST